MQFDSMWYYCSAVDLVIRCPEIEPLKPCFIHKMRIKISVHSLIHLLPFLIEVSHIGELDQALLINLTRYVI